MNIKTQLLVIARQFGGNPHYENLYGCRSAKTDWMFTSELMLSYALAGVLVSLRNNIKDIEKEKYWFIDQSCVVPRLSPTEENKVIQGMNEECLGLDTVELLKKCARGESYFVSVPRECEKNLESFGKALEQRYEEVDAYRSTERWAEAIKRKSQLSSFCLS